MYRVIGETPINCFMAKKDPWFDKVGFDPEIHAFVSITKRSPSGRWESDDLLIVSKLEAVALKLQHGKDFDDLTHLVE